MKCFFIVWSNEVDLSAKIQQMPNQQRQQRQQRKRQQQQMTMADNAITTTSISGANELMKYIQGITEITQEIRQEFEESLRQPDAIVEYHRNEKSTQFTNAEMSAVSHRTLVYHKTKLSQHSKFLQAHEVMVETLKLFENLRKMLVNNKQQKKTTIRNIRATINELKQHQQKWIAFLKPELELELEASTIASSPSIVRLETEIETTKQNHRTITNRILKQVNLLCFTTRRNILNFKLAAEETIGEIIRHAEKCRAFIMKCRQLEIIEFCASIWWFDRCHSAFIAEHPELSERHFTVSAELDEKHDGRPMTMEGWSFERDRIKILVQSFDPVVSTVCEYDFDQTLAEEILTDEAIQTFERETSSSVNDHDMIHQENNTWCSYVAADA